MPVWVPDGSDMATTESFAGEDLGQRIAQLRPHAPLKNIDPLVLSELLAVVLEDASEHWLARIGNPPPLVSAELSVGNVLWCLPPEFVARLASADERARKVLGARWADSENAVFDDQDCADALDELATLCRAARDSSRHVYYWA